MYCGIDVAKNKSNVCILDNSMQVFKEFEIVHNANGFEELEKHLTPETKIAMEVTGNYSKIVYNFLKNKYDVCYVDGMQMTNIARYHSPTIKNDKIDAKLLAKALSFPDLIKVNPIKSNDLKDLSNLYQKVTLNDLNYYKAPTEKRFYDGAAIANLSVNYQGQVYNSQGFDHGNPPVEIADFINKIVSFTEN